MSPDTFLKRKSGWISEIFAENSVHYLQESKHAWQTACCETESKTVCLHSNLVVSDGLRKLHYNPTET